MIPSATSRRAWRPTELGLLALAGVGALGVLGGLLVGGERFWPSVLLVSVYLVGLGLTGPLLVALASVTGASWCLPWRRVLGALSHTLVAGGLGMALLLTFGLSLYPWLGSVGQEEKALEGFKGWWLGRSFFLARSAAYLSAWIGFAVWLRKGLAAGKPVCSPAAAWPAQGGSASFLVVFGVSFWLASDDWLMSLEPQRASTIFAIYVFAGMLASGLAALALVLLWLRAGGGRGDLADSVNDDHLHDIGKLLLAASCFWGYVWFCEYMLTWYVNLPRHASHFVRRLRDGWQWLFLLNLLLNWVVPFVVLLPRWTKRHPRALSSVAAVVLVGHWLDLYLMIFPAVTRGGPAIGPWEVALSLGLAGAFPLLTLRALRE